VIPALIGRKGEIMNDQLKISLLLLTVFLAFTFWISVENETEIQRLTEENMKLKAGVDSLRVEYYAKNISWGLTTIRYR